MKQAIEEHFILDVLQHYVDYGHLVPPRETGGGRPEPAETSHCGLRWRSICLFIRTTSPRRPR